MAKLHRTPGQLGGIVEPHAQTPVEVTAEPRFVEEIEGRMRLGATLLEISQEQDEIALVCAPSGHLQRRDVCRIELHDPVGNGSVRAASRDVFGARQDVRIMGHSQDSLVRAPPALANRAASIDVSWLAHLPNVQEVPRWWGQGAVIVYRYPAGAARAK